MATKQDILDAQKATADAVTAQGNSITAAIARIGTGQDLSDVLAGQQAITASVQANTAAIDAIAPAPVAPPVGT